MSLLLWSAVFIVALLVLVKAADYFTRAAEKIGKKMGIPAFIVGVTIVSIGTSLPEIISSILAVLRGTSEMVVGNVIGSNITNIFLILGISAIVSKKLILTYELIHVDLPIFVGSGFVLAITIWDGIFTKGEAGIMLAGIFIYFMYMMSVQKTHKHKEIKKEMKGEMRREAIHTTTWLILVASAIAIYFGADYTVRSVIELSTIIGIGTEIIAITVVALGTSLPELVVSITAARQGKPEIAVGNILGSNIFNTFAVMGIPGLFGALLIPQSILYLGLPIMIMATIIYFFMTQDKQITQWEGWMLLLFYVLFIGKQFGIL
ncbi:MAG: calcium/sodium antiporter [Candidatus Woesearchaeota archaeon]|jgi:cation:H+ antiporter|nr:calcium/sodium antiporter [Candidatus Woesearchaeota archaeon]MDP7198220.1 calcium/sodium antiporter [Candidatus Woesearchaeota archaeon]MDP7467056.1 calcium/sodium antiporter [Candidatus Woesearchaeota archaeon]MDP7646724.1 calcium/sodium antiporter [Candidatus Woesearchaeota archaeon]